MFQLVGKLFFKVFFSHIVLNYRHLGNVRYLISWISEFHLVPIRYMYCVDISRTIIFSTFNVLAFLNTDKSVFCSVEIFSFKFKLIFWNVKISISRILACWNFIELLYIYWVNILTYCKYLYEVYYMFLCRYAEISIYGNGICICIYKHTNFSISMYIYTYFGISVYKHTYICRHILYIISNIIIYLVIIATNVYFLEFKHTVTVLFSDFDFWNFYFSSVFH